MITEQSKQTLNLDVDQNNKNIESEKGTAEIYSTTNLNTANLDENSAIRKLTNQINLSTRILEEKEKILSQTLTNISKELGKTLDATTEKLNKANDTFSASITDQQKQYEILQKEVGILSLLPEKTKEEIEKMIPNIAKELDKLQQQNLKTIHNEHQGLAAEYTKQRLEYQKEQQQIQEALVTTISESMSSIDQQLERYSQKLSDSAIQVIKCSNVGFLKNMCLVVLFSAVVSGVTAYAVTTRFPRYFNVTGASSIMVHDSNVHVLGGELKNKTNNEDKKIERKNYQKQ